MSSAAPIFSAIAAISSAITAIIMMRIQRKVMLDSTRPDLILTVWDRNISQHGEFKCERLTIGNIKNIGKGSALHIIINSHKEINNKPIASSPTQRIDILPVNEEHEINREIILFWDNIPSDENGATYLIFDITIGCLCSKGYRHDTIYTLAVLKPSTTPHGLGSEIAPGVVLITRKTIVNSVRMLTLFSQLSRLPGIGKYWRSGSRVRRC
jgi:hypothetical protein